MASSPAKPSSSVLIFSFFELEPRAASVFSFGKDIELNDDFFKSPRLVKHAKHYMDMVDRAIGLLGPDIELLTEILMELGRQHTKFGVESSFYPPMGHALIHTMEEVLGDKFSSSTKNAWLECYQALAYDMIQGANNSRA
jgi:hypothetical protein